MVAVTHPRTFEFGTRAVGFFARVRVGIVIDSFVFTLAAKNPRAFCNDVKETLAITPVLFTLPAGDRKHECCEHTERK